MDWKIFSEGFSYVIALNGGPPQNGWDADEEFKGQATPSGKKKWMRASVGR